MGSYFQSLFQLFFEDKVVICISVSSLSILLWDILNNMKNDYRMLFPNGSLRLGFSTMIYFISRITAVVYALVANIFWTASQSIPCKPFEVAFIGLLLANMGSTLLLAYLRVCAVWHCNRFIVGFFGLSWLSVVASGFTLINGLKVTSEGYTCIAVVGAYFLAPFITSLFNHVGTLLAITYGVCKNAIGRDMTFRDCIQLMFGKNLPTFSKALLHDSQLCYIIIMVFSAVTIASCYVWGNGQSISDIRLGVVPLYIILTNIMICRVFRNTKLGLYSKIPLRSSDATGPNDTVSGHRNVTETHSSAVIPIQISVSQVIECQGDNPPLTMSKDSIHNVQSYLDFGMV